MLLLLLKKVLVCLGNINTPKAPMEVIRTQILAAVGPRRGVSGGGYYKPDRVARKGTSESESRELAGKLWEWTEGELDAMEGRA